MTQLIALLTALLALALFAQSLFSLYLMLYTWEHPERLAASRGPREFLPPALSFTVLLPARHEEAVIYETVRRVWAARYPKELLEVVVICHADDHGTIAEAQRAVDEIGSPRARVLTFADPPINKPHGLNVGFQRTRHEVVTIFDAEDDIDPDIFNVVNTVMQQEQVGIVQAGVQLMNCLDHWFSMHNCLEYFFWFKSRLHLHAHVGMIPLGGNTVFFRRELIARVGGWDEGCLTEDADIGLRLSRLGEPIRIVYDAGHVTREETPATVGQFVRQRTRWHQGFLQVLGKGDWRALPHLRQRLLAAYTLSYPLVQALLALLWPLSLSSVLWLKLPVVATMISFLPLYSLLLQLLATIVGAYLFAREYRLRLPLLTPLTMAITFLPFQMLLGISAVRAVYRQLRREGTWEKTAHAGAHRQPAPAGPALPPVRFDRLLDDACARLGTERGSVLVLDPDRGGFVMAASRGLPAAARRAEVRPGEGLAGWVAERGRPLLVDGRPLPAPLARRLLPEDLRSSLVVPIRAGSATVGVLSVASRRVELTEGDLRWLRAHVRRAVAGAGRTSGRRAQPARDLVNVAQGD
jgi:cellulose synthase/poly-beta-1,6-N-acetylglucosamine synthase-like glycosyltransferase